ncbi:response regulator [bacterium]|nr:response regulator [bacterium]
MKIMIVDDSKSIRFIVKKHLLKFNPNFTITEAENGKECIERVFVDKPDLVVMDVNMPIMNGDEAVKVLKTDLRTRHIDIMMLTTEAETTLVMKLLKLGIKQYMIKPFKSDDFKKKFTTLIQLMQREGKVPDFNMPIMCAV